VPGAGAVPVVARCCDELRGGPGLIAAAARGAQRRHRRRRRRPLLRRAAVQPAHPQVLLSPCPCADACCMLLHS
jgi:hypothetical protein